MLAAVARFEIRYLLRNPLVWVTALLTFAGFFAATSSPDFELGNEGGLVRNASYAIVRNMTMLSVLYVTVVVAFLANAITRDDETGYSPIIRATRIRRSDYLLGRFFGALGVVAACLCLGLFGLWLGSIVPWSDPAGLGPQRVAPYAFALLVVALPNLFISGALLFTVAALTRSMLGTYLGVIAFASMFFFIGGALDELPSYQTALALIDPFAVRVVEDATRYWTVVQRNVMLPEIGGLLLANRLLWLTIAGASLAVACRRYRFAERGMAVAAPDAVRERTTRRTRPERQAPGNLLWMRTRFESWQVISTPAFPVLMAWGLFVTLISLTTQRDPSGSPTYPTTLSLIPELNYGLEVMPILVAVYFGSELVWRERDRRIHEIIDASPMPSWAYVLPKTIAMAIVLSGIMLVSVLAAVTVQLSLGFTELELGKYLLWFVIPNAWDMVLIAAVAVFVHALSPHKVVGWGVMLLAFIAQQVFGIVEHNLLVYGGHPAMPLSDLAQAGSFWIGAWVYRLYWGAVAALLLVAAHVLWRRGVDVRLTPRIVRVRETLRGAPAWVAGVSATVAVATGSVAFYNTNVLGGYEREGAAIARMVDYERRYAAYLGAPHPIVSHLTMDVALYPDERRAEVTGSYRLRNDSDTPITEVHTRTLGEDLRVLEESIDGAQLVRDDSVHRHRIYRLALALAPGEEIELRFRSRRWVRGFKNGWPETRLIENGSFLYESQLAPVVGVSRFGMLDDPDLRSEHGLPPLPPTPSLDNVAARRSLGGSNDNWATADITVSTSADQVPLAAGNRVSDVTEGGRRTARFVFPVPARARFVVLSARYAERTRMHEGVELAVYYHPAHEWNVERMLDAAAASLDYYRKHFGPYQFDHFRIVELPGYYGFAQAFGGTVPYSETVGFIADFTHPDALDQVTGMVAHELAHQWWAHQVAAAEVEGAGVLSETLAQYSAHVIVERMHGEAHVRRYLRFGLDRYLDTRFDDDPPLARARGEYHLLYRKGVLAMYLLRKRLGEDAVNRALRTLVTQQRFAGPPYATTHDLLAALRAEATTEEQQTLITDLFERVTLYDLAVDAPTAVQRPDGRWDVTVPVVARKAYVDSTGAEHDAELREAIEVGLFTADPNDDGLAASQVLLLERVMLTNGRQELRFVTDQRPLYAGVDPYNYYIDRRLWDNSRVVK